MIVHVAVQTHIDDQDTFQSGIHDDDVNPYFQSTYHLNFHLCHENETLDNGIQSIPRLPELEDEVHLIWIVSRDYLRC